MEFEKQGHLPKPRPLLTQYNYKGSFCGPICVTTPLFGSEMKVKTRT